MLIIFPLERWNDKWEGEERLQQEIMYLTFTKLWELLEALKCFKEYQGNTIYLKKRIQVLLISSLSPMVYFTK